MVKNKFDKSPKSKFSNTFWRRIFVSPLPKSTIRNVLGDFCRFPGRKVLEKSIYYYGLLQSSPPFLSCS